MTSPLEIYQKVNKFRAQSVRTEDGFFASKREHKRWLELKLLERAGAIQGLDRQKKYVINVNGQKICSYIADFTYSDDSGFVVEDAKGFKTPEYKLKKKLMLAVFGIEIKEV